MGLETDSQSPISCILIPHPAPENEILEAQALATGTDGRSSVFTACSQVPINHCCRGMRALHYLCASLLLLHLILNNCKDLCLQDMVLFDLIVHCCVLSWK